MATNLGSSAMQTEDEEQWLYGVDTGNQEDGPIPWDTGPHPLKDIPKERKITLSGREDNEEDSDSDSDDYIQVMIGNITTRRPSYMC
ncbi:Hypothetical predicted protein [Podarcis lilfordi]|uniref:Uncharacterized protein n=1 Tax=Podarcis lilfordi TaxID=74358 RepID=A0AA35PMT8_9SAUR|nr:Hypothetical predicted protein [Podarcis lilfordi]